jgi:hypothetical protein
VTQDVAEDFQVDACIDLSAGVRMSKCMCTNHLGGNSSLPCLFANPVTDCAAGQWVVRYHRAHKYPPGLCA